MAQAMSILAVVVVFMRIMLEIYKVVFAVEHAAVNATSQQLPPSRLRCEITEEHGQETLSFSTQ